MNSVVLVGLNEKGNEVGLAVAKRLGWMFVDMDGLMMLEQGAVSDGALSAVSAKLSQLTDQVIITNHSPDGLADGNLIIHADEIDNNGRSTDLLTTLILDKQRKALGNAPSQFTVTHPNGEYPVIIGENILMQFRELTGIEGRCAILTDSNVGPLYAQKVAESLGEETAVFTMPAGEQNKTLDTVRDFYDQLIAEGYDRSCTILGLGGGVVGDVAGFVAASFMRGINFVNCPTSLLSMVDASVGGKTGVDMPQGKNLIGAFKQPIAVLADVSTLITLPPEELTSGMAEVIKHGLLADPLLIEMSHKLNHAERLNMLQTMVTQAIQVKQRVVQEDPYEKGIRAYLNLGHTFGHAVEQVSQYSIRHGEAVAMGLMCAAHMSAMLGEIDGDIGEMLDELLPSVGLPNRIPANLPTEALLAAMQTDKKKKGKQLRFILLRGITEPFMTGDVTDEQVIATLNSLKKKG